MDVWDEVVLEKAFCNLRQFKRSGKHPKHSQKLLIVAPMSGHYATLLRDTVRTLLQDHDVYITDWHNPRDIPLDQGKFGLDEYTEHLITFMDQLGPKSHMVAVCQPSVSALAACAIMSEDNHRARPASLTLMAGPIDTRIQPTKVNEFATSKPLKWFEDNLINYVPMQCKGAFRKVYPGFIQVTAFVSMNLERHVEAHKTLYQNLVKGDCDSVQQHRAFYEEYLSVMDLPAEFFLQTIRTARSATNPREVSDALTALAERIDTAKATSALGATLERLASPPIADYIPALGAASTALAGRVPADQVTTTFDRVLTTITTSSDANAMVALTPVAQALAVRLDEAVRGKPLDFFVVFSSTSATTGPVGQMDYVAANAFHCSLPPGARSRSSSGASTRR